MHADTQHATAAVRPAPVLSAHFWRDMACTMRPYLMFVSGAAGLAGLAVAPSPPAWAFVVGFLAAFASYGFGQALTDVFQTDTDALSARYRPLVQGRLSRRDVLLVSLVGLLGCGMVFLLLNRQNGLLALLGVLGLATYTPAKRRFWAGPCWNAAIVALLPLMTYLGGSERGALDALRGPVLPPVLLSVFFGYAVFVVLGYLKDVSADRATGYRTVVVRFGWVPSVLVSALFALVSAGASGRVLVAADTVTAPAAVLGWTLWGAGLLSYGQAHFVLLRVRDEHLAHLGIVPALRAFVLQHLALVALYKPLLAPLLVPYAVLAEWAWEGRPERRQV
ncbi:MAG: UbiA family prenyltransferase [Deltaproteobacteria bacterium]|nr:UbiA family prenyltransferase [Deltaproteobacteria bacterium]